LGKVKPKLARTFAERGLSRMTAPEFHKDYRVLLQTNAMLGRILQGGLGWFRGADPEKLTALTASLPSNEAAFLRQLTGLLREAKDRAPAEAAWPAFEQHWDKTVRGYVEAGLNRFLPQVQFLTNNRALYERGLALAADDAVLQNFDEAAQCFRKAAEQGHAGAQLRLGMLYESGRGVREDFDEAMRWYRKAAAQKEPHATCRIAELFREGKGVHKDLDEAAKWYRTEAEGECAGAQVNLARIYDQQNNTAEALKWYRRGAESGNVTAQAYLGDFLSDGLFTTPDYVEACQWLILAAQAQTDKAMEFSLRRLKTKLTPDQLKEAEERAEKVTRRLAEKEKERQKAQTK
jgi:TPR repeat protein